jgi:hypothetical protein
VVAGALALGVAVLACIYYALADVNVWETWRAGRGLSDPSYAERIYENSVFRTRANTWSNYAFVIVGAYIVGLGWVDRKNAVPPNAGYLVRHPVFSFAFGLGCVYLGFASGLFHASLTRLGQQLDVASMYTAMIAIIAMNFSRLFDGRGALHTAAIWISAAGIIAASIYLFVYKWEMSSKNVLSTLILMVGVLSALDIFRKNAHFVKSWMLLAALSLVLAVIARQTGIAGTWIFPGPDTWLQGHAVWHVFCAASLGCAYLYFRSERQVSVATSASDDGDASRQVSEAA